MQSRIAGWFKRGYRQGAAPALPFQPPGTARIAVARVLLLASGIGCSSSADEAIRIVRVFDLIAALPRASTNAGSPEYISRRLATLGGHARNAIFMHPAASAEYPAIEVTASSVFTAFIGLDDAVLDKPGDGVEFTVRVKLSTDVEVEVFSQYVDNRRNADRGWTSIRVPLGAFAGQHVRLVLSTAAGPAGNNSYDWALWGEPRLILDEL